MKKLLKQILENYNARSGIGLDDEVLDAIRAEIDKPEPEPAWWVVIDTNDPPDEQEPVYVASTKQFCHDHINDALDRGLNAGSWAVRPAYAAPPKPKPLSDEEINNIFNKWFDNHDNIVDFVRAIEQAHGIGDLCN